MEQITPIALFVMSDESESQKREFPTLVHCRGEAVPFHMVYSMGWTLLFIILSSVAFVFIPVFVSKRHSDQLSPPQRKISLQRFLLGSLVFLAVLVSAMIVNETSDNGRIPPTNIITLFGFNLLLLHHLTERETKKSVRRYLFNLFQIEEPIHRVTEPRGAIREQQEQEQEPNNVIRGSSAGIYLNVLPVSKNNTEDV